MTDKVIHHQALRNFLVTILVLGPGPNRFDDLRRDVEKTIEIFDVGIGGCGLSNAEAFVCFGRKDDGAQLVCFERVADGSPGRMDASVKERLLDSSQQMIGNHAKKRMSPKLHQSFALVESGSSRLFTLSIRSADGR